MLAAALQYAARGLPVFPCDFGKRPLLRGEGFKDATADIEKIQAWWTEHPLALIGMPTGEASGFFVIDIDGPAHGADGLTAWDELCRGRHVPLTRRHETARGGVHLLFNFDRRRPVTNRRGALPPGIDVRGEGGYIIAPPSEIPDGGGRWSVPDNCETDQIADAPDWLYELINSPDAEPARSNGESSHSHYARAAFESELAAVASAAPGARNERLNRAAFSLGQLIGASLLSESETFDRLYGAAQACGLVRDDGVHSVRATIASGLAAGKAKPREIPVREARHSAAAGAIEQPAKPASASSLLWYGDAPPSAPRYLVADTLPEVGLAILGGQFGFAKTFVGADLASAVMLGGEFAGRPVLRRGGVLWLAAEGENEIEARIRAAVEAKGADPEVRQPFARQANGVPCLSGKDALAQLEALAAAAAERLKTDFGLELALIAVDTLSAAGGFEDENSAAETQKVMNALAALARTAKALVLVIDHHGKTTESGVRGSSAKSAAADAIIAAIGDRDPATGDVTNRRVAVTKLRSGPTGRVVAFDLKPTEDGATCIVQWRPEEQAKPAASKAKPWPKALIIFKRALDEAIGGCGKLTAPRAGMPEILAVDREAVRTEFMKLYPADEAKAKRTAFLRCEKDAIERGIMAAINVGPELTQTIFWLLSEDAPKNAPE